MWASIFHGTWRHWKSRLESKTSCDTAHFISSILNFMLIHVWSCKHFVYAVICVELWNFPITCTTIFTSILQLGHFKSFTRIPSCSSQFSGSDGTDFQKCWACTNPSITMARPSEWCRSVSLSIITKHEINHIDSQAVSFQHKSLSVGRHPNCWAAQSQTIFTLGMWI